MLNHRKTTHALTIPSPQGKIRIEGPVSINRLNTCSFSNELSAFRKASEQYNVLQAISQTKAGRVIIAHKNQHIVGYVTFVKPDPAERWSQLNIPQLLMLGGIEVSRQYRHLKIATNLVKVAIMDPYIENYIIVSTEYYWHWDIQGAQLNVWEYKEVMKKIMNAGGFEQMSTDDPEILSHPANCLMVRIGNYVCVDTIEKFNQLRFLRTKQLKAAKSL